MATKKRAEFVQVDEAGAQRAVREIENEVGEALALIPPPRAQLDADGYRAACELLLAVKARQKIVDGEREGFLRDARALVARVEGWFAPARERLNEAEAALKAHAREYVLACEARAYGLRAAAGKTKDGERANELLTQADSCTPPQVPGISYAKKLRLVIDNPLAVPSDYCRRVPDEAKILAALEAGEKVPGVRAIVDRTVRVTAPKSEARNDLE